MTSVPSASRVQTLAPRAVAPGGGRCSSMVSLLLPACTSTQSYPPTAAVDRPASGARRSSVQLCRHCEVRHRCGRGGAFPRKHRVRQIADREALSTQSAGIEEERPGHARGRGRPRVRSRARMAVHGAFEPARDRRARDRVPRRLHGRSRVRVRRRNRQHDRAGVQRQIERSTLPTASMPSACTTPRATSRSRRGSSPTPRGPNGELLLLSNEMGPGPPNLSFEREFGKLIAYQDTLALVMAQRTNRTIRRVSQALATAVFLPL